MKEFSRRRELQRLSGQVVFWRSGFVVLGEGVAHHAFVVGVIATHHGGATSTTTTDTGESQNYDAEE